MSDEKPQEQKPEGMPQEPVQQFTPNQQGRIDAFTEALNALSIEHGCKIVPSVVLSPMGAKYMINVVPDEILNPQIVKPNGPVPNGPIRP